MPRLYDEFASWWPLLSAPADYAEEAAFYARILNEAGRTRPRTVLELGSGGGSNASHLKARFEMVLVDRSDGMLAVSRALNPECEHIQGDMRRVRLGRQFDAVGEGAPVGLLPAPVELHYFAESISVAEGAKGDAVQVLALAFDRRSDDVVLAGLPRRRGSRGRRAERHEKDRQQQRHRPPDPRPALTT